MLSAVFCFVKVSAGRGTLSAGSKRLAGALHHDATPRRKTLKISPLKALDGSEPSFASFSEDIQALARLITDIA